MAQQHGVGHRPEERGADERCARPPARPATRRRCRRRPGRRAPMAGATRSSAGGNSGDRRCRSACVVAVDAGHRRHPGRPAPRPAPADRDPGASPHDRHDERASRRRATTPTAAASRTGTGPTTAADDDRRQRHERVDAAQQPAVAEADLAAPGRDPEEASPPPPTAAGTVAASRRIMAPPGYGPGSRRPKGPWRTRSTVAPGVPGAERRGSIRSHEGPAADQDDQAAEDETAHRSQIVVCVPPDSPPRQVDQLSVVIDGHTVELPGHRRDSRRRDELEPRHVGREHERRFERERSLLRHPDERGNHSGRAVPPVDRHVRAALEAQVRRRPRHIDADHAVVAVRHLVRSVRSSDVGGLAIGRLVLEQDRDRDLRAPDPQPPCGHLGRRGEELIELVRTSVDHRHRERARSRGSRRRRPGATPRPPSDPSTTR